MYFNHEATLTRGKTCVARGMNRACTGGSIHAEMAAIIDFMALYGHYPSRQQYCKKPAY